MSSFIVQAARSASRTHSCHAVMRTLELDSGACQTRLAQSGEGAENMAGLASEHNAPGVQGFDPRTGEPVGEAIAQTSAVDLDRIVAAAAASDWSQQDRASRARALSAVADAIDSAAAELAALADQETALGIPRLSSEIARTTGQLRMFSGIVGDGNYVDAAISPGHPSKATPDVRRMLFPRGPVAVFAASNFPFAFSVLGGDTASALAAGCPVVVKAHEAHPSTSRQSATIARDALRDAGFNADILSVVFGFDAGTRLISHPSITAAGFTGSLAGGRALAALAAARSRPIPFFGELGSVNPVVILPGAAAERPVDIARNFAASLTLGSGQFCTNPGLLFVPADDADLIAAIRSAVDNSTGSPMLTERMRDKYQEVLGRRADDELESLAVGGRSEGAWSVRSLVWTTDLGEFQEHRDTLSREVFGPAGLVIRYSRLPPLLEVLAELDGNLTATIHAANSDYPEAARVAEVLRDRAGRLIFNGWPTGVAVCWAMHHGGPWPATTDAAQTSIGAHAIDRWLIPKAFQDWPDELLPPELQEANPTGITRRVQPESAI
jgi:NADP-dependent aldehyde dehydrogenase